MSAAGENITPIAQTVPLANGRSKRQIKAPKRFDDEEGETEAIHEGTAITYSKTFTLSYYANN
jgi:hypothetical protein